MERSKDVTMAAAKGKRYLLPTLATLLLVGGGIVGGMLGYRSEQPVYRAEAVIYIDVNGPAGGGPPWARSVDLFEHFVAFQVRVVESARVASMAVESEAWKASGQLGGPDASTPSRHLQTMAAFRSRCDVIHKPGTAHIGLGFSDVDPAVAFAGCRALSDAYMTTTSELRHAEARLAVAEARAQELSDRQRADSDLLFTLTAEYGGPEGLELRHRHAVTQLLEAEEELSATDARLAANGRKVTADNPSFAEVESRRRVLSDRLKRLRAGVRKMSQIRVDVSRLQAGAQEQAQRYREAQAQAETLAREVTAQNRIMLIDPGVLPTQPHADGRPDAAIRGACLGGFPGLLLLPFVLPGRRRRDGEGA